MSLLYNPDISLGFSYVKTQMNDLLGKVLTVIDASTPPNDSRAKALKDVIKSQFSQTRTIMGLTAYGSNYLLEKED